MINYQFPFEKLEVWQMARILANYLYKISSTLPPEEKFSLVSQLRSSVVSVAANIAEGSTRTTAKDQAHFTTLAYSSLMETYSHLIIAFDLGYLEESRLIAFKERYQLLSVKLSNLKASQVKRIGR